jgi:vancomycin resistance protein YoaR
LSVESPTTPTRSVSPLQPLEPRGRAALERAWSNQRTALILLAGLGILFVLVSLTLTERIIENGDVMPGVRVGDIDASGMSERDALAAVRTSAARLERTPVQLKAGSTELTADPGTFGLHVNARASVRAARKAGRSHNPLDQLSGVVLRRMREDKIPFVLRVDRERLDAVLDAWVTETGKGLVDGGLRFEGTTVVEIAPKSGTGIQRVEARRQVLTALSRGDSDAGTVSIGPTSPAVGEADVRRVAREARAVLATPVTVTVGMTPLVLAPEQVASTLSADVVDSRLVLHSDAAKLRAQYGPSLAFLEVAPKDASFATNGSTVSIIPAITGKLVNLEALGREIAGGNHSFAAELVDTQPARTTEWAQKLNITELVGSFTTAFPPGQPRVKNIQIASSVIDGTILLPGETFSLNDALGPRTLEKGYVLAPGIGPDLALEDAVGGGVSQVSTTLYNASFFGCYQDVTHSVHALYIPRYPMGREATLNYPSIDNQFRNDSSSGVLIRSFAGSTSITVALYGNKGGRTCRGEGPNVLETILPALEYVDDPALLAGSQKIIETGHTGYVVENFRIISVPGQPDKRERYVEHYASTPTKIARGTGAAPPPPPAATTPAPTG